MVLENLQCFMHYMVLLKIKVVPISGSLQKLIQLEKVTNLIDFFMDIVKTKSLK